ncbi:hypothetical protein AB1Y20_010254 [Prymnesium parvum]|uniref:Uncharacterized protein n=1 Tax=Prymnesium parvum TaxID=97485 RepID=A0AB34K6V8_PRYPA
MVHRSFVGGIMATVLLIRHADRYDYAVAQAAWKKRCAEVGPLRPSDPPLSALGHRQARALAAHLSSRRLDAIFVSPYLRALQTAQPLAHATGLPLLVDPTFSEAHQYPRELPPLAQRLPYFPEIDETYAPMLPSVVTEGADGVEPHRESRLEHMRRMIFAARRLRGPRFAGKTVAIVTHAASVGLIAALRAEAEGGATLEAAGKLAPCGVYELRLAPDGTLAVEGRGDDTSSYTSGLPVGPTSAWGFASSKEPLESSERTWQEALRLGPTDPADVRPVSPVRVDDEEVGDVYEPESV